MTKPNPTSFAKTAMPVSSHSQTSKSAFETVRRRTPVIKQERAAPAPQPAPRPSGMGERGVDIAAGYRKLYAPERTEAQKAKMAKAIKAMLKKQAQPAKGMLKSKFNDAHKGRGA